MPIRLGPGVNPGHNCFIERRARMPWDIRSEAAKERIIAFGIVLVLLFVAVLFVLAFGAVLPVPFTPFPMMASTACALSYLVRRIR